MIFYYMVDGQIMTNEEAIKAQNDKIIIRSMSFPKSGYRPVEFNSVEKFLASEVIDELNRMEGEDLWYSTESMNVYWELEDNFFVRTTIFKHMFIKE